MPNVFKTSQTESDGRIAHWVYLISSGPVLKIGHSARPERRRSELQCSTPVRLTLEHKWRVKRIEALRVERELHDVFAWARRAGEWFDLTFVEAKSVGDLVVAGHIDAARCLGASLARLHKLADDRSGLSGSYARAPTRNKAALRVAEKLRLEELERAWWTEKLCAHELGLALSGGELWDSARIDLQGAWRQLAGANLSD